MATVEKTYATLVTDIGVSLIAAATMKGEKVNLTTFAVGDGGGTYYKPISSMTSLKGEKWCGSISIITISEKAANIIDIVAVVPSDVGGWTIREMGIYNNTGSMIAICNTPDTEKVIITSGAAGEIELTMHIEISNTSSVSFNIDPTIITATKKDIENHNASETAHNGRFATPADVEAIGVAIRNDFKTVEDEIKSDILSHDTAMRNAFKAVDDEIKSDISSRDTAIRTELKQDIDDTKDEVLKAAKEYTNTAVSDGGFGDMLKSTYDSDGDGKVNAAVNADKADKATKADTAAFADNGTYSLTHTRASNSTVHMLSGTLPATGMIHSSFIPTSDFTSGDTFKINNKVFTATDSIGEPIAGFKTGIPVPILIDAGNSKCTIGGGGGAGEEEIDETIYDVVIKTQAEFDAMLASPTWLDAESVLFVGDGGTLQFTRQTTGILIPSTVKTLVGINNAKIAIISLAFDSITNKAALWYQSMPSTDDYSIKNLEVQINNSFAYGFSDCINLTSCHSLAGVRGFNKCTNLTNCRADISRLDKLGLWAFNSCTNLINCYADVTSGGGSCFGYQYCEKLINCTGYSTNTSNTGNSYMYHTCNNCINCKGSSTSGTGAYLFIDCTNLANCTGSAVADKGYGIAFDDCVLVTNCDGYGTTKGTALNFEGFSFYSCKYLNGCKQGDATSTTAFLGGTNLCVDSATVKATP